MKRLFAIIGTVPLALLAACGGDDSSSSATIPSATTQVALVPRSTTAATSTTAASAGALEVVDVGGMGKVLATSDGMVLYVNDEDTSKTVKCVDTCTAAWPPVVVTATPTAQGVTDLGTVSRPDGTKQATYIGHPLYTFKNDSEPMKPTGDGASDQFSGQHFTWHVATVGTAAGGATTTTTPASGQAATTTTTPGSSKAATTTTTTAGY